MDEAACQVQADWIPDSSICLHRNVERVEPVAVLDVDCELWRFIQRAGEGGWSGRTGR